MIANKELTKELNDLTGGNTSEYTLEELLELVPDNVFIEDGYYRLFISAENGRWRAQYGGAKHHKFTTQTGSLADTLCKLAVRLKKENLL